MPPYLAFVMLTGMRRGEALAVDWSYIDLEAVDHEGRVTGLIELPASVTKTNRARQFGLEVSPGLRALLSAIKPKTNARLGHVFGGDERYTAEVVESARARMISRYGAPEFTWQMLRSTCATYLTCSTGIWGAATVFLSARQLGHSVAVAERHYLGVVRGIPRDARSLEAAMQAENELTEVVERVRPTGGLRVVGVE